MERRSTAIAASASLGSAARAVGMGLDGVACVTRVELTAVLLSLREHAFALECREHQSAQRDPPPRVFVHEWLPSNQVAFSSDVQCAQRVALSAILDRQYGHSFVVGAASAAGLSFSRL